MNINAIFPPANDFPITIEVRDGDEDEATRVVVLSGHLNNKNSAELGKALDELLSQGCRSVILDFEKLESISDASVGLLLSYMVDTKFGRGGVRISHLVGDVFYMFKRLGFTEFFKILDERD